MSKRIFPEFPLIMLDLFQNCCAAGAKNVWVSLTRPGSRKLKFVLEDDGCGMDDEKIASLMSKPIPKGKGKGKGVPIAREYAKANHGTFTMEPNDMGGITVTMIFQLGFENDPTSMRMWRHSMADSLLCMFQKTTETDGNGERVVDFHLFMKAGKIDFRNKYNITMNTAALTPYVEEHFGMTMAEFIARENFRNDLYGNINGCLGGIYHEIPV